VILGTGQEDKLKEHMCTSSTYMGVDAKHQKHKRSEGYPRNLFESNKGTCKSTLSCLALPAGSTVDVLLPGSLCKRMSDEVREVLAEEQDGDDDRLRLTHKTMCSLFDPSIKMVRALSCLILNLCFRCHDAAKKR
jgi:hypothetical protein